MFRLFALLAFVRCASAEVDDGGAPARLVTIQLDKQQVPVVRDGITVAQKTAYFGKVALGFPLTQEFSVVFDTGSGHLFLPGTTCTSRACFGHHRYDRSFSATAEDINFDGDVVVSDEDRDEVSIIYGTGEITGAFIREKVCLDDGACTKVRVILASEMTDEPFSSFRFDGVAGLGLPALALDPEFSFLSQLGRSAALPQARFGYFLSQTDSVPSEISFGGHDERRTASQMQWEPVHRPELGYWQVKIKSILVDGDPLEACADGDCTAIADTGTSLLGVPEQAMRKMHVKLARKVPGDPERLDCRQYPGPQLVVELNSGVRITLDPEDYSRSAAMRITQDATGRSQVVCRASLMPVDPKTALGPKAWILGEPVLRKYYTAYDWEAKQIGFALAAQDVPVAAGPTTKPAPLLRRHDHPRPPAKETPSSEAPAPSDVHI